MQPGRDARRQVGRCLELTRKPGCRGKIRRNVVAPEVIGAASVVPGKLELEMGGTRISGQFLLQDGGGGRITLRRIIAKHPIMNAHRIVILPKAGAVLASDPGIFAARKLALGSGKSDDDPTCYGISKGFGIVARSSKRAAQT